MLLRLPYARHSARRRGYPMTLAETASTFGEQVLMNGLLDDPPVSDAQKAMMLDVEVGHGAIDYWISLCAMNQEGLLRRARKRRVKRKPVKRTDGRTQRRVVGDVLNPAEKNLTSGHQSSTSILPA